MLQNKFGNISVASTELKIDYNRLYNLTSSAIGSVAFTLEERKRIMAVFNEEYGPSEKEVFEEYDNSIHHGYAKILKGKA